MPRRRSDGPWRRLLTLSIASFALAGCANAPGMRMQLPSPPVSAAAPSSGVATESTPDESSVRVYDIGTDAVPMSARGAPATADASRLLTADGDGYRVGTGDVLQIIVWDHPELAQATGTLVPTVARPADAPAGFVVDSDGMLQFPYAGVLPVAGLTVGEIRTRLTARLARTFRDPQLTVRVASFRSQRIYIEGEVREPGSYALNDTLMTLPDAIGHAGGFSAHADQSRIGFTRGDLEVRLDLSGASSSALDPARIVLRNGDRIRIASREDSGVFVMGEVNKPIRAIPSRNGRLTLSDALAQAGSVNQATADAAQLYVIRASRGATPDVYRLDATSPVAMILANQFELEPQDIVYIDGSGLVRLHRLLSLLMPAMNAGLTAAIAAK
ncbi:MULTISPECIES: polysaccharide biosynthesis/export family protein [Burkholderia]|uniref:polysaccharide biosynthesis/export family protein n=1 Tax=Burkholderia TaxID=32008 RepID=UPI00211B1840|nr:MULTISPECIES: polysaccharide biosynthesis/export family protein [Burkholderia]